MPSTFERAEVHFPGPFIQRDGVSLAVSEDTSASVAAMSSAVGVGVRIAGEEKKTNMEFYPLLCGLKTFLFPVLWPQREIPHEASAARTRCQFPYVALSPDQSLQLKKGNKIGNLSLLIWF